MSAAARLAAARESGLSVRLDAAGILKVEGPTDALACWVPQLREVKPDLLKILNAPAADTETRRLWRIHHADGRRISHSVTPGATLAEVRGWYPDALGIEPEDAPPVHLERDTPPAGAPAVPGPVNPMPAAVACVTCAHWRADQVGDGSGLGACLADAPASKRPGSLWPASLIRCGHHLEVTP